MFRSQIGNSGHRKLGEQLILQGLIDSALQIAGNFIYRAIEMAARIVGQIAGLVRETP